MSADAFVGRVQQLLSASNGSMPGMLPGHSIDPVFQHQWILVVLHALADVTPLPGGQGRWAFGRSQFVPEAGGAQISTSQSSASSPFRPAAKWSHT